MAKITKKLILLFITTLVLSMFVIPQTASADLCDSLSESTAGFFSCGEGETTFTKFKGGLTPPTEEGYDATLTQETNLRDFIINVVNFVLGFLGLAAVIVVIYGGVRYVTAAGQEEAATKGKKSIQYAIIGIIIVLISFALVNTVIRGIGQGTDRGIGITPESGLSGAPGEEFTTDQVQSVERLFFMAALKVERAAKDLATSYTRYVDINDLLNQLNIKLAISSSGQLESYLTSINAGLQNIISSSSSLSDTARAAKDAKFEFAQYLFDSQSNEGDEWEEWWSGVESEFNTSLENLLSSKGVEEESVYWANQNDFANKVADIKEDLVELKTQIGSSGLVVTAETDIGQAFKNAETELDNATPLSGVATVITNGEIISVLESLATLHELVLNIKFIASVITTDVERGNSPLIVNVDALNSARPDFESINEEDISWDFGDGAVVEGRFATSHVYRKTGAYVIKLTIKGDAEKRIASGISYKDIIVEPPKSQINLKVNIGDRDLGYLSFYQDGYLVIDKTRLSVTLTEARDTGITLDASETIGGSQTEQEREAGGTYIQTVIWEFGDGSDPIYGEMVANDVQIHYYGDEGTYPVSIEVTDSRGITDRKVFEIVVASPAARISLDPGNRSEINQTISFDAGQSNSDGGQITSYNWEITNAQLHYSADSNEETFSQEFESPGVYKIRLDVTDNLGNTASEISELVIESKPPQAKFVYSVPDDANPHIYELDGTQSFDPDGNVLEGDYEYKWTVAGLAEDYDFVREDGTLYVDGDEEVLTYVKFYRTGQYKITLFVDDANEPENPGIEQSLSVNVDSILDVAFDNLEESAAILNENSEAEINFVGLTENGVAYEWDFGDQTDVVSGNITNKRTGVSHTYDTAGTYDVRLTVFDKEDNENTIKRRIIIGEADTPIAVIAIKVDGVEYYDLSEPIVVNRKSVVEFDSSRSLNRDGTGRRLGYQWNFGDTQKSTQKLITHTYTDLSPTDIGHYVASLKVLDKNDLTKLSISEIQIDVQGELPTIQAFTAVPEQTDLITPVRVKLEAIGAKDPDGNIVKYLWWYYNLKDPSITLGHTITQAPQAYVNIGTRGIEGEETAYGFGLQMTDQENYDVEASEILAENLIPSLTVINGPNEIPISKFNVDVTSIMIGEMINFTSSSHDPDGNIVEYVWDFEGDGFGNNKGSNKSTVAHQYNEPAPDGINVRLKVIDNNFAESISQPVRVYIDTNADIPTAAFSAKVVNDNTVQFTDMSVADEAAGAELVRYSWDFDISSEYTSADTNNDGVKDNDIDSIDKNPSYTYPEPGIYRAKLTVEDNLGNKNEAINFINVKPATTDETLFVKQVLNANFTTTPSAGNIDNAIHLTGQFDEVRFDFSKSTGDIVKYTFDNNIYEDSNDNGRKADDVDYQSAQPGVYTTTFNADTDRIKVRLTVYDAAGNMDIHEVRIVFDNSLADLETSVFRTMDQNDIPAIFLSLLLFGIISSSLYLVSLRFEKKRINKSK